jgi:hypothetical protein
MARTDVFECLSYGRACDGLSGREFRDLVLAISRKPGGLRAALGIVTMRLWSDQSANHEPLPEVHETGRVLLLELEFHHQHQRRATTTTREDYDLGVIVRASLPGPEGVSVARTLCRKLMTAAAKFDVSAYDYDDLMKSLLQVHPTVILDELFSGDVKSRKESVWLLHDLLHFHETLFDVLPDEVLLAWCDRDPAVRYPLAASVVPLFKQPGEGQPEEWITLTGTLLEKAPDPILVLNEVAQRLYPSSWSGSLATKLEGRLKLLNSLPGSNNAAFAAAMANEKARLQSSIDAERRQEKEEDRARNNRFE